ncbi:MAG: class I adenylate-forming enzyme family protein [Minwuia sp.]|uniref:class I adenylate-forming enzyme family protein n=1 Tax=Minwuia sp. TaxID=2493630 RepID=UPI003A8B8332
MNIDVENFRNRRNDQRWNRMAVGDIIERITWATPDKDCLIATPDATVNPAHARLTYRQANDLINRIANALLALDLPEAARIGMLVENSNEAWLSKVAIAKAGLVAVPVNTMMAPDVITDALERLDATKLIADKVQYEKLGDAARAAGSVPIMLVGGEDGGEIPSFDDFIADHGAEEPDVTIHSDDVWEVLFTSGTTAKPKAAMISHTYTYMAAMGQLANVTRGLEQPTDLRMATFTPMTFHIGDQILMFAPLLAGGTVIMGRKPDGHVMAKACTQEAVTYLWGGSPQFVESMIRACEETPLAYDLTSVRSMSYGWAPMSPGSLAKLTRLCAPDFAAYELIGQTECVPCHCFHINRNRDLFLRTAPAVNYVGRPVTILGATVMDQEGNDLWGQPDVEGEAVYRSPAMFSGYYNDRKATEESLKGGWFHSGDSFKFDAEGNRIMVDRYKDIVKSGGENVSSIRVEAVLQQHPAVARAAVVGTPDDRWGEMVTACIIANAGKSIDEQDIIAFCRERLAGFETPKKIVVMEAFPETVGGKILKYKLRTQLAEQTQQAAE